MKFIMEVRNKSDEKPTIDKRDANFAMLTELDGWQDFKDLAKSKIDKLMSMRDYDAAGRDLSELGLRFLVADIVAGEIEDLIKRVEQSRDIYNENQKEKHN